MTITLSEALVPMSVQYLSSLSKVLDKAELHAEKRKIDPDALLNARLVGIEVPSYEDNEKTFTELRARIAKTLAFVQSIDPAKIDGSKARDISMMFGKTPLKFKGQAYLLSFALPSMIFHVTIAYAILRHNGVEIGKFDFLSM
jgi:hypothetical protein